MAVRSIREIDAYNNKIKKSKEELLFLRDSGLEYVTSQGVVVPAKVQPRCFCICPKQCKGKLRPEQWKELFRQFYELGDQNQQNSFLQCHIIIKTIHKHNWDDNSIVAANKRRVTCKYHVPDLGPDESITNFLNKKSEKCVEVCQKAFMNVFAITEKRVRLQRERNIAMIASDYFMPNARDARIEVKKKAPENVVVKKVEEEEEEEEDDINQPLDLSNAMDLKPPASVRTNLYEIADLMGISRDKIDRQMEEKYEEMVLKNIQKQQKMKYEKMPKLAQKNGHMLEEVSRNLRGISQQVVGLQDDFTILPIQTLNNGDLTITPVLGSAANAVENQDIMRVNIFFQNQLWRPEYIGLTPSIMEQARRQNKEI